MHHTQISSNERPARAITATWNDDMLDHQSRFAEVVVALLPASLILATATALLVALL